ncbi:MAG: beta-ketoacyl-[Firmicutes bacterium]|nr:beta-ketoacyl-[acyl-carrier-protein] synthase family protein [Bacillota bacterium]
MSNKLVITGMGMVTPIGIGVDSYWENLQAGKTGIDFISKIDTEDLPVKFAGECREFVAKDFMPRKLSSEMDRFMQMAYVAAAQAIEASGGITDPYRTGITVGTALNGIMTITDTERSYSKSAFKRVGPRFLPKSLGNVCASQIAIANDIHGPSMTLNTACASGGDAITLAAMMMRSGMADAMVVAGAESATEPILIQSLAGAQALSVFNEDPKRACRPFDKDRDGFVLGEGAGALVIETEEHAKARGAQIFAEIAGCGNNTDAYHPVTPRPDGEGEILCMKQAIAMAGIEPSDIGYINTHGTATIKGDIVENESVKEVFGEDAKKLILNSTKAATGHMMGAGGITEVITCVKALETGIITPTLNLENQDPECDLNYASELTKVEGLRYAMSNAFGFGGQNSSIIVGKY